MSHQFSARQHRLENAERGRPRERGNADRVLRPSRSGWAEYRQPCVRVDDKKGRDGGQVLSGLPERMCAPTSAPFSKTHTE